MAAIRVICELAGGLHFTVYFSCVASTSSSLSRNPCTEAGIALGGRFMLNV